MKKRQAKKTGNEVRVFLPKYENGAKESAHWWVDFRHEQQRYRLKGFTHKAATESLGRNIKILISKKAGGESLAVEQQRWLNGLPKTIIDRLAVWGFVGEERVAGTKPLLEHVEDWRAAMLADGNTVDHADLQSNRVRRIFDACKFRTVVDVVTSRDSVKTAINSFRRSVDTVKGKGENRKHVSKDVGPISSTSKKYYLQAAGQFFRWMIQARRAVENPIASLSINSKPDSIRRRALTVAEITCLMASYKAAGPRFGMKGYG